MKTEKPQTVEIGSRIFGEVGMSVLEGTVELEGNEYGSKQLLVAKNASLCTFNTNGKTTFYLFGGEPFEKERYMFWNFVNSGKKVLEKAKKDWKDQNLDTFPKIPDDGQEFVPLPESKFY